MVGLAQQFYLLSRTEGKLCPLPFKVQKREIKDEYLSPVIRAICRLPARLLPESGMG